MSRARNGVPTEPGRRADLYFFMILTIVLVETLRIEAISWSR